MGLRIEVPGVRQRTPRVEAAAAGKRRTGPKRSMTKPRRLVEASCGEAGLRISCRICRLRHRSSMWERTACRRTSTTAWLRSAESELALQRGETCACCALAKPALTPRSTSATARCPLVVPMVRAREPSHASPVGPPCLLHSASLRTRRTTPPCAVLSLYARCIEQARQTLPHARRVRRARRGRSR